MAGRTSGRIIFPKKPGDLLNLALKINEKHDADGGNSPLNAMKDYDWAITGPKVAPCLKNNNDAEAASKKAEEFYRQRDVDLPEIKKTVRNSAALLKSVFAKNPKVLGDYGFVVDDSPQVKKPKK